jgi:hypothetical protein
MAILGIAAYPKKSSNSVCFAVLNVACFISNITGLITKTKPLLVSGIM